MASAQVAGAQQDTLLVLGGPRRPGGLLDWPPSSVSGATLADVRRLLAQPGLGSSSLTLVGGEVTLRADLLELVVAAAESGIQPGIWTDGLSLGTAEAAGRLRDAGLARVRITFCSARTDAHDWLIGVSGAARRAAAAIRTCRSKGLEVEADVVVTRPTTPYLEETAEVLLQLGVTAISFRRITRHGAAAKDFVTLSPRFGLCEPHLEAAVRHAVGGGVRVEVRQFPRCAVGPVSAQSCRSDPRLLLADEALSGEEMLAANSSAGPCLRCPGLPACGGAPRDYVARFGWAELRPVQLQSGPLDQERPPTRAGQVPEPPPHRAGRFPATRVAFSLSQARRGHLEGDPLAGVRAATEPVASQRFTFRAPSRVACAACGDAEITEPEPTRDLRMRLVSAAQEGAPLLRIASAGALAHPESVELLRETKRLAFSDVEVAGEASRLAELSDEQCLRLKHLGRVDISLYGPSVERHDEHSGRPGSFRDAVDGALRFSRVSGVQVGAFAVLHDHEQLADYAAAWRAGELPGKPAFRLSERGGSLDALAGAAARLEPGPARDAIAAVLPACLLSRGATLAPAAAAEACWAAEIERPSPPSGSDIRGRFLPCLRKATCPEGARCPGLAVGWSTRLVDG